MTRRVAFDRDVLSFADSLGLGRFHVIGGSEGEPQACGTGASSER